MSEILLVDDDPQVRELLQMYLTREGYTVRTAGGGREALTAVHERRPALVVLDIMMPEMDGYEVCRALRASWDLPIIFLTCKDDDIDPIIGLEMGADDYIAKPFNPREVVARIRAVLRRAEPRPATGKRLSVGGLDVSLDTREVLAGGVSVRLTPKEFDILWLLASHPRVVFSREQIISQVWGYDGEYFDVRTVDTHVKRLRKKLHEAEGQHCTIEAVWGTGYRFISEPEREHSGG